MKNKTFIIAILTATALAAGCATDAFIQQGASTATSTYLESLSPANRTLFANYFEVGANVLRTLTGNPTDQDIAALIGQAIPANVKSQYPQMLSFLTPQLIHLYNAEKSKFWHWLSPAYNIGNDVAIGVEAACAPYIGK